MKNDIANAIVILFIRILKDYLKNILPSISRNIENVVKTKHDSINSEID